MATTTMTATKQDPPESMSASGFIFPVFAYLIIFAVTLGVFG